MSKASSNGIRRVGGVLLGRHNGLFWVDSPVCDKRAARLLSEVFGHHPLAIRA